MLSCLKASLKLIAERTENYKAGHCRYIDDSDANLPETEQLKSKFELIYFKNLYLNLKQN